MKKRFFQFLLLIMCFSLCNPSLTRIEKVNAQSPYLRVTTEDTPFFSDEGGQNLLFYLPYTYYVKIISENVNFYHVEYGGEKGLIAIDGYVPKDNLFDDTLTAESRYPQIKIRTSNPTLLYSNSQLTSYAQYVFSGRELNYYGKLTSENGEILYYVEYNNRLGYVKEADIVPFTVPIHPNPLTFIPEPEPSPPTQPTTPEETKENNQTLRYVIIGCLAFAGIFALMVALKSKPQKVNVGYFEENEYE